MTDNITPIINGGDGEIGETWWHIIWHSWLTYGIIAIVIAIIIFFVLWQNDIIQFSHNTGGFALSNGTVSIIYDKPDDADADDDPMVLRVTMMAPHAFIKAASPSSTRKGDIITVSYKNAAPAELPFTAAGTITINIAAETVVILTSDKAIAYSGKFDAKSLIWAE